VTREEFENLQIGGRNLLRNGDFSKGLEHWQSNGSISLVNVDGKKAIKLTGTAFGFYQYPTNLEENTYYTISLKAKSVGETSSLRFGFLNQGAGLERTINVDSTWRKYTFTTTKFIDFNRNTLLHFYANNGTAEGVYITEIKLEKGNKATDWTPAPEDVDERVDGAINRISQAEATLSIHADQIEAKAEKSEVYTRSEVDSALSEKVDTTVFTEQIGTLTTSINSVSARVSNTEAAINSITGEIEDVLNQVSSLEVTTNGIVQSVSSIEGELSDVGNRLTQAESSITTLSNEIELKASQTEVDTIQSTLDAAVSVINVLPGMIALKVDRNVVIGAINASPEELLIDFERIRMEGMLEARHIKSLNGLNVNDQFIVDPQGNVKLAGTLEGATGTFIGEVVGGSIKSNTTIDVTTDLRVGNNIYVGQPSSSSDKYIILNDNTYLYSKSGGITLRGNAGTSIFSGGNLYIGSDYGEIALTSRGWTFTGTVESSTFFRTVLWTGQAYPLDTQTIRPSKRLSDCMTGWVLKFQRYIAGEGVQNSHYQYVHIHKIHEWFHNGAGVAIALGYSMNNPAVQKYLYIYNDRIVGHADNNQGVSNALALTGVYEY